MVKGNKKAGIRGPGFLLFSGVMLYVLKIFIFEYSITRGTKLVYVHKKQEKNKKLYRKYNLQTK